MTDIGRFELGRSYGDGLHERQARFRAATEWPLGADDVLARAAEWRPHIGAAERDGFACGFAEQGPLAT